MPPKKTTKATKAKQPSTKTQQSKAKKGTTVAKKAVVEASNTISESADATKGPDVVAQAGTKRGREAEDEPVQPAQKALKTTAASAAGTKEASKTPSFIGTFDVYSWTAAKKPLQLIYLGDGIELEHNPDAVYDALAVASTGVGHIGTLTLPSSLLEDGLFDGTVGKDSEQTSGDDNDEEGGPIEYRRCPYQLTVAEIEQEPTLSFTEKEFEVFPENEGEEDASDPREGPGITAILEPAEEQCGTESAEGTLKMRRLWADNKGDKELFEGYLGFDIDFAPFMKKRYYMGNRKTHQGADKQYKLHFWAIRRK